jgi:glycosyltransferase involved in cell wall biosynthesis
MSAHPFGSVVIPAYNAARWIAKTLDSWVAQTERDFEVIVIDDGSSDATADIAESFAGKLDIRVVRAARRGAPAGPSNDGIRLARGRMILLCDADDMALPERVAETRRAWQANNDQECLIFSDFANVNDAGHTLDASGLEKYGAIRELAGRSDASAQFTVLDCETAFNALLAGCFIRPCAVAAPRSVFAAVGGYDERLSNGQDYDIFLRIAHRYPFIWIRQPLALYRMSPGTISTRPAAAVVPSRVIVLQQLLRYRLNTQQTAIVRQALSDNFEALGYDLGRRGQAFKAIFAYSKAFLNSPTPRHIRGMAAALIRGFAARTRFSN